VLSSLPEPKIVLRDKTKVFFDLVGKTQSTVEVNLQKKVLLNLKKSENLFFQEIS
jgi:hypothetical protein